MVITTTINSLYGSGVWVPGAGFFLNNEMDDFAVQPGTPNQFGLVQGEANAIAPGKRMLSAMAPTIVLDRDGKVLMLVGGRGGPRIITAVVQAIVNVVDYRMTLADAVGAPRIHDQALPDQLEYEKGGVPADVVAQLNSDGLQDAARGHGFADRHQADRDRLGRPVRSAQARSGRGVLIGLHCSDDSPSPIARRLLRPSVLSSKPRRPRARPPRPPRRRRICSRPAAATFATA